MRQATSVDWQTWADIATAAGVVIALAALFVGLVLNLRSEALTRKGQEQEQIIFKATAERAESAARLTEEYTSRVVDALESIATKGLPGMAGEAPRRGVRWSLAHHSGDRYILTNTGDATARGATVSSHKSLGLLDAPGGADVGPDEVITFFALPSLATSDTTITVAWDDEDGSGREWKYPLPMA